MHVCREHKNDMTGFIFINACFYDARNRAHVLFILNRRRHRQQNINLSSSITPRHFLVIFFSYEDVKILKGNFNAFFC